MSADYTPFGWCTTVEEEHARVEGSWSCRSYDGLIEDVEMTMSLTDSDLDAVRLTTIDWEDTCIEVTWYPIHLSFESELFSTSIDSFIEIFHQDEGDRTVAYNGLLSLHDIEGSLFKNLDNHPAMNVYTRDSIGTERSSWRVVLSALTMDTHQFICE